MTVYDYIGLYFFSAVFQGNMALLGLLGVFVVFKRQEITYALQEKDNVIITYLHKFLELDWDHVKPVAFQYPNIEAIPERLIEESRNKTRGESLCYKFNKLSEDKNFQERFKERKELVNKRSKILNLMVPPFFWILSVIFASLVLLPLIYLIHSKWPWLELVLIAVTIIGNVWALVETKRFVWKMLKD